MTYEKNQIGVSVHQGEKPLLGTRAYLAILGWSLGVTLLASQSHLITVAALCLFVNGCLYPQAIRRLFRPRLFFFLSIIVLVNALWTGEADQRLLGIVSISTQGFATGLLMVLRALVVLLAVDGFSSAVNISEIAGLFEKVGLKGLGFSIGVAVNLLPGLRQSSTNAWYSLKMRGGLRKKRWRGLQLLMVTVVSNSLRHAEEIALAAESRAFSTEHSRPMLVRAGSLDSLVLIISVISAIALLVIK
jgi:energy-coupling factor transporter transmembrane protein EcfT